MGGEHPLRLTNIKRQTAMLCYSMRRTLPVMIMQQDSDGATAPNPYIHKPARGVNAATEREILVMHMQLVTRFAQPVGPSTAQEKADLTPVFFRYITGHADKVLQELLQTPNMHN